MVGQIAILFCDDDIITITKHTGGVCVNRFNEQVVRISITVRRLPHFVRHEHIH